MVWNFFGDQTIEWLNGQMAIWLPLNGLLVQGGHSGHIGQISDRITGSRVNWSGPESDPRPELTR